ncbi:MAG: HAMP domain-containing sensor histidine kinase [Kofleriaceae bacterium]
MRVATKITLSFQVTVLALVATYAVISISNEAHTLRVTLGSKLSAIAREAIAGLDLLEDSARSGTFVQRVPLPGVAVRRLDPGVDLPLYPGDERVVEHDGWLELARGYVTHAGEPSAIIVTQSLRAIEHGQIVAALWTLGAALAILMFATFYSVTAASRLVGVPIDELVREFRRVGGGDLTRRAGRLRADEFGKLQRELDVMIGQLAEARFAAARDHEAKLELFEQLRHSDRLATVGRLASGLAHELGTPLNVIAGYAKLIESGQEDGEPARDAARIIGEQSARVTEVVRQLLDFARRGRPHLEATDLGPVLVRAVEMVAIEGDKRGVRVVYRASEVPVVAAVDVARIQQVIVNLAINAIHASPAGSEVVLALARSGNDVEIEVLDHGCGIPKAQLEHVFEPFFTTKPVGEGTGLGLAVSHGIIAEHRGRIRVVSDVGKGSTFTVSIPGVGRNHDHHEDPHRR